VPGAGAVLGAGGGGSTASHPATKKGRINAPILPEFARRPKSDRLLDIKVNGEVVGKIAPDSYFFIDRKPGTYTLGVEPPLDFTYFEADVQVAAGRTYYYSINARTVAGVSGGVFFMMTPIPITGHPIEAKSGSLATYTLRALDAAAAIAAMRDLDAR
jgi:Protein of unknown function (DUF2846)